MVRLVGGMSKVAAYLTLAGVAGVLGWGAYGCHTLVSSMTGDDYDGVASESVDSLVRAFEDDEVAATARLQKQLITVGGKVTRKEVVGSSAQVNAVGSSWGYVELHDVPLDEAAALDVGSQVVAACRLRRSFQNSIGSRVVLLKNCRNVRTR